MIAHNVASISQPNPGVCFQDTVIGRPSPFRSAMGRLIQPASHLAGEYLRLACHMAGCVVCAEEETRADALIIRRMVNATPASGVGAAPSV